MRNIRLTYISFLSAVFLLLIITSRTAAQDIKWHSFEDAIANAKEYDRPILVDIWAPWCGWCHKMKEESYPKLSAGLANQFVFTRLNRDDNSTSYQYKGRKLTAMRLAKNLNAQTVPTVVILSSDGEYLFHISGFLDKGMLQSVLRQTQHLTSRQ